MSRICLLCNREFEPRRANQKYCSKDCYKKANNRYCSREKYQEGIIYTLDMERWRWKKKEVK